MSYPLHIGERNQYFWNSTREAVAEYVKAGPMLGNAWQFMGWLWDGRVSTPAEAQRLLSNYLAAFPSAAE